MAIFGGWRLTRTGVLFVIGIIVLAGLVTGAVFVVKNRGEAVRREEAVKVAEQELNKQSEEVATQPVNGQDEAVSAGTQSDPDATTESATVVAAEASASQLPQTGPAEVEAFGRILIVTLLALSVSFYVASRRAAKDL